MYYKKLHYHFDEYFFCLEIVTNFKIIIKEQPKS